MQPHPFYANAVQDVLLLYTWVKHDAMRGLKLHEPWPNLEQEQNIYFHSPSALHHLTV